MSSPTWPLANNPLISLAQFQADLPVFVNAMFADDVIQFWLNVAYGMINQERWGEYSPLGMELFAAHHIVLDTANQQAVNINALPGLKVGAVNSKSVGPVSLSFDTASATEENGGFWNQTTYGTRYLYLARQFGAGPVYIGAGCAGPAYSGGAWAGPWTAYIPNPSCSG